MFAATRDLATSALVKVNGFFASFFALSVYFHTRTPASAAKTTAAIAVNTRQFRTLCPFARNRCRSSGARHLPDPQIPSATDLIAWSVSLP